MGKYWVPYRTTYVGEALVVADTPEEAEAYVEDGDFLSSEDEELIDSQVTGSATEDL